MLMNHVNFQDDTEIAAVAVLSRIFSSRLCEGVTTTAADSCPRLHRDDGY